MWWTKIFRSDQDDFIAAKHYHVWHPSRKKEPRPRHIATGQDWQSRVVMLETEGDHERWKGEVSTGRGTSIAPALLQRSGPFVLVWFAENCAITQPAYHQLRKKFEKLEFVSHPDRAAIHVRHRGSLVALVWPCSVPNRITSAAARNELAVRAVLEKKENPLGPFLRRRLASAANHGPEALWLAVQKLLQLTENMEASSTVWTLQGVTDWRECSAVEFKDVHYVFNGTDVPVAPLFQHLRDGSSVDDFLAANPAVTKQQVQLVLDHAALTLFA
ncbi:MAG: DUF433 domain-containing protein [Verrucomicrobiota bacterium]